MPICLNGGAMSSNHYLYRAVDKFLKTLDFMP